MTTQMQSVGERFANGSSEINLPGDAGYREVVREVDRRLWTGLTREKLA